MTAFSTMRSILHVIERTNLKLDEMPRQHGDREGGNEAKLAAFVYRKKREKRDEKIPLDQVVDLSTPNPIPFE
jgi:hypothetical protein